MPVTRRSLFAAGVATVAAIAIRADEKKPEPKPAFKFCLNTSTIRIAEGQWGKPRSITDCIDIASKAGYSAIEPWIQELDEYTKGGGTLKDLGKRFADAGLETVMIFLEGIDLPYFASFSLLESDAGRAAIT